MYFVMQMHGFTCGVDDLLITKGMDSERITQLESCEKIGDEVLRKFIDVMKDDNIGNLNSEVQLIN
jgi:DNA-directed RNA polymerase I subunit RPA1